MKRKKITSLLLLSAMAFSVLLSAAGCGSNDNSAFGQESIADTPSDSASANEAEEASTEKDAEPSSAEDIPVEAGEALPEASSTEESESPEPSAGENQEIHVEAGTVLEYKMAFYFDESVASNEADVIKKVVQNLSNGYESLTDESLLNDEDTYQLFWAAEEGATLTIPIEIPADGRYDIGLCLHMGGDFGTHQIFIGETLLTEEDLDLYSGEGGLTDFSLGAFDLTAGETELMIRCTGQNEASAGSVFGINALTLTCEEVY